MTAPCQQARLLSATAAHLHVDLEDQTAAALADAEVYRLGMLAALDALRAEQLAHGLTRRRYYRLLDARRQAVAA